MKLRPATKEDYDILFELFCEIQTLHYETRPDIFRPAKKDQLFFDYFDRVIESGNHHLMMGFDDDKAFGYIYYVINHLPQNIYRPEKRVIYINHILVTKGYQGRGLGRALINHVRDIARKETIKEIGLDVWAFNEKAIGFFKKQGFSAYNQVMWHSIPITP
ncbi:MAG: GNAT family N-acetyltransferase [Deltaproteobacteria bacterium]|jgi:GNAT superfamily N-acetyltransferase|nr:GNAT family N-acetyltransferase [Deltaproteobacteria bacterium]